MRSLVLALALSMALAGCGENNDAARTGAAKQIAGNAAAGKAVAERECKSCHGLDGKGIAPAIPNLAAQRERYLAAALTEYKEGKRPHAALKDMAAHMTDAELHNVAAYYAGLPPVANAAGGKPAPSSAHEQGKSLAKACAQCHGEDGNAKTPGIPNLAGQQPHYLVTAIQEYHQGERETPTMKAIMRDSTRLELEQLALYFASQKPASRGPAHVGDAAAGEPLSAVCGGCHGARGVSADAATPSLAGQDPQYLVRSIKSYRTTRKNWGMQRFVGGLGDKDIDNVVAYYATQTPQAADTVPSSAQELAQKCNRCHDDETNPSMAAPKMNGQDKDYLVMALRAYRDDKRESTTMHKMTTPYSNAIIDSVASWYAGQPAK
jgi:cytochrome c553